MIDVVFNRDGHGRLSSFFARGHAEFAIQADDVVCAAVSAILQAARLGLQRYAGDRLEVRQQAGQLDVEWPPAVCDDPSIVAIATTAALAVEQLMRQYPEHVRLRMLEQAAPQ